MIASGLGASIGFLLVLLCLSGFFSGSETALFSLSKIQRRRLERRSDRSAKRVSRLLAKPKRLLVTILLGNMSVNTLSSATATALCLAAFGDVGIGVAVPVMTLLLLIFGELTPKVLAVRNAEAFSLWIARPLEAFGRLVSWPSAVLEALTDSMIETLAPVRGVVEPVVTVDELSVLMKMGAEAGELETREKELVDYIFEFQETVVREVMTPRVEIDGVKNGWSVDKVCEVIRSNRSARVPVFTESFDDIYGILHARRYLLSKSDAIEPFIDDAYFVPEGKKVHDLLQDFRERSIKMAIVLDEHGGVVGLVTLEDLLEEIFGEVYDEDDEEENRIVEHSDGSYSFAGDAPIDDVSECLGVDLTGDESDYDTIAGCCMAYLGRIPRRGDSITIDGWELEIARVAKRRILEVVATCEARGEND